MGVNVDTFDFILCAGFAWEWFFNPIPRDNINITAVGCLWRRSLDAPGLLLHYLNYILPEFSLQQIFALIPCSLGHLRCGCLYYMCIIPEGPSLPQWVLHYPLLQSHKLTSDSPLFH